MLHSYMHFQHIQVKCMLVTEVSLDLVLTSSEEVIKEVKIRGSLDYSDHALVEFVISRNMDLPVCGVRIMNIRRDKFQLFKELLNELSWEDLLRGMGME